MTTPKPAPTSAPTNEKCWIVYDERAINGDSDDAAVLCALAATTEAEAIQEANDLYKGDLWFAIYRYDVSEDGQILSNETQVFVSGEPK